MRYDYKYTLAALVEPSAPMEHTGKGLTAFFYILRVGQDRCLSLHRSALTPVRPHLGYPGRLRW